MTREQWDELFAKVYDMPVEELEKIIVDSARKAGVLQTNYDLLISKTPEELARFITDDLCELFCGAPSVCDGNCEEKMLSWLKSPVEGEG